MASIELCKIVKAYGSHQVIKPLDLNIADGAFTVLVGPSGCGKSTLLRLIAGLEDITDGDAYIGDTHINHVEPARRDVAMVFQSYALYPHLNVADNIAFHMKNQKVPANERNQKVQEVARMLGIEHLLDRLPKDLSGGQRQRVAMGRAMVRKPKVFLFDEPLSNLDAQLRMELRAEIKAMHQALRTTTVYVTHDQVEAMTLADQIVVMKDGSIVQQGSPLEIYDQPANTFVARFIGSPPMNLIAGTLHLKNGLHPKTDGPSQSIKQVQWLVHLKTETQTKVQNTDTLVDTESDCSLDLDDRNDAPGTSLQSGQTVTIGFRPNQIRLDDNSHLPPASVHVVEMTGDQTLIHAQWLGEKIYIQHPGRVSLTAGQPIRFSIDKHALHLFDEAGNRL